MADHTLQRIRKATDAASETINETISDLNVYLLLTDQPDCNLCFFRFDDPIKNIN